MKNGIVGLAAFALIVMSFTTSEKKEVVKVSAFQKEIKAMGLEFSMPAGYEESDVKENRDLQYSFAIKNKTADFEVRYSVWSLKPELEEYEKCKKDPNCLMVHPNKTYTGRIQANVLNMTGGQDWDIGAFPAQAVKREFNADDGGSSFFEFNCEFGKGYKYGQMIYLHKDNVADVIITYMSNYKDSHSDLMEVPFHALTFKN
ncbi:hypothetical protein [Fluviicola taffensis]|uniref:hypothetical protein n=1 Tax=Fluviicola taffensis TaxID=191579 RepID=UPI0031376F3B